jgi:hypothetical protein
VPSQISTSLATADTRTYVYPSDATYVTDSPHGDDILYTLDLAPRQSR